MKFSTGESQLKLEALKEACLILGFSETEILTVPIHSVVHEQPFGYREIVLGASYRALCAARLVPDSIGVGIENGVLLRAGKKFDLAIIALAHPSLEGGLAITESEAVEVPEWVVAESQASGWLKTIGQVLAQRHPACQQTDPHGFLSNGVKPRAKLLANALVRALHSFTND